MPHERSSLLKRSRGHKKGGQSGDTRRICLVSFRHFLYGRHRDRPNLPAGFQRTNWAPPQLFPLLVTYISNLRKFLIRNKEIK